MRMLTWSDNAGDSTHDVVESFTSVDWPVVFGRLRAKLSDRRRPRPTASQQIEESFVAFAQCLDLVERAKASLASAAPGGRVQGLPLAEALAGFEEYLRKAGQAMPPWRTDGMEESWQLCMAGLEESFRRADALRLGDAPSGYEQLYTVLADLMEPLDAFAAALSRYRGLRG
jgi:hypothetical protein